MKETMYRVGIAASSHWGRIMGIVICCLATEAMAANKVKGIRCALAWDLRSARLSREHNDANVLSVGQRMMAIEEALEIVELWLNAKFEGARHQARIDMLDRINV